jgi:hypothetical protein
MTGTSKFTFVAQGNSHFLKAVADALETFETLEKSGEWAQETDYFRKMSPAASEGRPFALAFGEIAGAFAFFMASCFGKKIFDEIYDRTAKRPIAEFLTKILSLTDGKPIEYRDAIYLEDIKTLVIIRSLVHSGEERQAAKALLEGHRVAHLFLTNHGRKAEIHCHTIEGGKIDLNPELFDSLDQFHLSHGKK